MATKQHPHSDQLREAASHLRDDVQQIGRLTKDMAQDTLVHLRENASDYYKQGMAKAQHMEKDLESKIQKYPLRSVLIAAGIGLVIGALWKKR